MGRAASERADHVVLTSDNPRSESPQAIIDEILPGLANGPVCDVLPDRREAIHHALASAGRGDVVLVAGKGHEVFQEFAKRTVAFDDKQVIQEELAKL
jgi:UDP-N-acetylmuramoyl-L-alanyl-D-glutamate--2,6-diaminopimelate ligase